MMLHQKHGPWTPVTNPGHHPASGLVKGRHLLRLGSAAHAKCLEETDGWKIRKMHSRDAPIDRWMEWVKDPQESRIKI